MLATALRRKHNTVQLRLAQPNAVPTRSVRRAGGLVQTRLSPRIRRGGRTRGDTSREVQVNGGIGPAAAVPQYYALGKQAVELRWELEAAYSFGCGYFGTTLNHTWIQ